MDKEQARKILLEVRCHLEKSGIIKPIRKEPISEEIAEVKKPETLEAIEERSFQKEEFKENELGF